MPTVQIAPPSPDIELALAAAGQIAYRIDLITGALSLSGAIESLTGREAGSLGGALTDWLDLIHEKDRTHYSAHFDAAVRREGSYQLQYHLVTPDGAIVLCEDRGEYRNDDEHGLALRIGTVTRVLQMAPIVRQLDQLTAFADYLPDVVSVHGSDGRFRYVNRSGRRLLGINQDEDLDLLAITDVMADSTSVSTHLLPSIVLSNGSHFTEVVLFNRRLKRRIPASWSGTRIDIAGEEGPFLLCIARDLSTQLEMAMELRQYQQRLTHALDVSGIGEWSMDVGNPSSVLSKRVAEIFGYEGERDEWNYQIFLGRVHPQDREMVAREFQRALELERDLQIEARIFRSDGEMRWISAKGSTNRGLTGDNKHIGGVIQDITQRKYTEQRDRFLADVSLPLNTLFDHRSTLEQVAMLIVPFLADVCCIDLLDEHGMLERTVSTSSLLTSEAVHGPAGATTELNTQIFRKALESGTTISINKVTTGVLDSLASSRAEYLSLRALNVSAYLGTPLILRHRRIGMMHFYRNSASARYRQTDRQLAEELARRVAVALENARLYRAVQERDARKDEFLAMLSHELRNPLESLSVGVSLLETEADKEQREWAHHMMRNQITKLSSILEDLLDVSRYTFGKILLQREVIDIAAVLQRAVDDVQGHAMQAGYQFEYRPPAEQTFVDADAARLSQVFGNLLTNAVKYGGGTGRIEVMVNVAQDWIEVSVSDEGIGIAHRELKNVFELFSQVQTTIDRSRGGLGMGLTLVKRITEMHGGTVAAESEGIDRGSRFVVRLPRASAPVSASIEDASAEPPGDTPKRLLLVDDNQETAEALQRLFTMKGFTVQTASDGLSAIELALEFRPDAAVIDIGLPGANGYEVAAALRQQQGSRALRLIALSGYGQQQDRDRSTEAGFDHHLVKPVHFQSIVELLPPR